MASRQERRKAKRAAEKLARNATHDENMVPGSHRPVQEQSAVLMRKLVKEAQALWPGCELTVFVFEPPKTAKEQGRLPRFNYASTVERPDMIAVLEAFIEKQKNPDAQQQAVDKFTATLTTEGSA